jgi:hypothetical protein
LKTFSIPKDLEDKYQGCGHGWVELNENQTEVLDFEYSEDFETPLDEQNILMTERAGEQIKPNIFICNFFMLDNLYIINLNKENFSCQ